MKRINKKLAKLKADQVVNDDLQKIVKRLKDEGIFDGPRLTGDVIFFNNVKGYGFLQAAEGSYFLHIQEVEGGQYPAKGDRFQFNVKGNNRAVKASKIN